MVPELLCRLENLQNSQEPARRGTLKLPPDNSNCTPPIRPSTTPAGPPGASLVLTSPVTPMSRNHKLPMVVNENLCASGHGGSNYITPVRSNITPSGQPSTPGIEQSALLVLTSPETPMSKNLALMPTVLDENLWASGHDEIESKLQVNFIFLRDQLVAQNVYTLISMWRVLLIIQLYCLFSSFC